MIPVSAPSATLPESGLGLRAMKFLTMFCVLGIVLAGLINGRKSRCWPFGLWEMYSKDNPQVFAETSMVEVRAVGSGGEVQRFLPWQIFPFDRRGVAIRLIERTFAPETDPASRQGCQEYLTRLVRRKSPAVQTIEGWRLIWDVKPREVPPLEVGRPAKEIALGHFAVGPQTTSNQ